MSKNLGILESNDRVSLTPMIDIIFLLLAYFMMTSAIQKEEGDLNVQLPTNSQSAANSEPPEEAVVNILPDGDIQINGQRMDNYASRSMPQLTEYFKQMKSRADAAGIETVVTIQADSESPHQRSVDALNACAAASIKMVTFGDGGQK